MNEKEADEILADAFQVHGRHAELPPATPLKRMPKKMRDHLMKGAGKEILTEFPKQPLLESQQERARAWDPEGDDDIPPVLRSKVH